MHQIFNMLGSKSKYFLKSVAELKNNRNKLISYLQINNYSDEQINEYLKAFDYFSIYPNSFDGATIVKDLHHIPELDINAMLHDFLYIKYNAAANYYVRFHADWLYAKQMEKTGKGILSWINFVLLLLTYPFFTPYIYFIKQKRCSIEDRILFFDAYETLIK